MKTLLLTEVFPPQTGGSGRWFWDVYSRLPRDEYVIAAGEHPQAAAFDAGHDVNVHRLPLGLAEWGTVRPAGVRGYWRAVSAVRRLPEFRDVSRIHCGRLLPEGWMGWLLKKRCGLPYVCYVHGEELSYGNASRELGWMMRRVLGSAEFVIANSENSRSILEENWQLPADKVRVLHPGVDATRYVPVARNTELRRRLDWDDRSVVLTVGRLQQRKGHDMLIRALPRIRHEVPDVLYAIAGAGDTGKSLRELAEREGVGDAVQFLGEIGDDELLQCYQQCDLFVLPNREINGDIEGFGIVLLEAQACGKPVIAGDSGGTAETMDVGNTGRIVDCTSPDRLSAEVSQLLQDEELRQQMGDRARDWAVNRFDWGSLCQKAQGVFSTGRVESASESPMHSEALPLR